MRADEPMKHNLCFNSAVIVDVHYINQLRYERLMAKAEKFKLLRKDYFRGYVARGQSEIGYKYLYASYKCERIAEALEARARRIKEGM